MPQTWSQPQITPIDTDFEPGTDNYPLATESTEDTEEPEDGRGKRTTRTRYVGQPSSGCQKNRLLTTDYRLLLFHHGDTEGTERPEDRKTEGRGRPAGGGGRLPLGPCLADNRLLTTDNRFVTDNCPPGTTCGVPPLSSLSPITFKIAFPPSFCLLLGSIFARIPLPAWMKHL